MIIVKGMIKMKLVPRNYYLDDLFNNFFEGEENKMRCDIYEKDNKYHIEMDIPGFKKDEIKLECNQGNLTITAEKNEEDEEKEGKKYLRRERVYGKYQRSFYLGDIDEDNIEASFEHGTLCIAIPKKEEKETKKYIEVK